ncbi:MAG: hypothetical protein J2P37_34175, partial [Ktedonobacteraceae bacterium]|nr:hypothetical protein [Ktedonobacteraceae bacterium]
MTKDYLHTSSYGAQIRTFFSFFALFKLFPSVCKREDMKTHLLGSCKGPAMALLIWPSQSV